MDTLPPTSAEPLTPAGPLLGLLSRGLELWLRQQCSLIEGLEIQLEGSAAQLMRGRLEGVRLRARRVVYQNLRFDRVELARGVIRVRMGALLQPDPSEIDPRTRLVGLGGLLLLAAVSAVEALLAARRARME